MELSASIVDGQILIVGRGVTILRLKAQLRNLLPDGAMQTSSRGSIRLSLEYAYVLSSLRHSLNLDIQADTALSTALASRSSLLERHLKARAVIKEVIEGGEASTGNAYWDETLDPHQAIATNCMCQPGVAGLCLFDEQGTGKTVITIAAFDILKQRMDVDVMILVTTKSLMGNWASEFEKFIPGRYAVSELEGSGETRLRRLRSGIDVFIIGYSTVEPMLTMLSAMAQMQRTLLVVDESYFVKNPDAQRSVAVLNLRASCALGFVLCGTPAPNRAADIINQFNVADGGLTFEGFTLPKDEHHAVTEIQDRIEQRGIYIRRLKSQVLPDLPRKMFNIFHVELQGSQKALYEKAKRELTLYLKTIDNRTFRRQLTTYFQKRAALLQICVSPKLIQDIYDGCPAKYAALDTLVRRYVSEEGKKIIIWSVYTRTLDDLQSRYAHLGVVRVDGTVTSSDARAKAVTSLQTDPMIRIFIGNPAAAGAGITLHAAAQCIYLSFTNQAAHFLQSLDRIHRRGQEAEQVSYDILICKQTIEENEYEALQGKADTQRHLLGDPASEDLTVEMALRELESRN